MGIDDRDHNVDTDIEESGQERAGDRRPPADRPGSDDHPSRADSRATAAAANAATDDLAAASSESQDSGETSHSAWEKPEVADDPQRPGLEDIRLTDDRRAHILEGDAGGGGHRHGTGKPRKTEFPADWDDETTSSHIADVARHPDTVRMQGNGRWIARGERDGVEMTTIVQPDGRIWSAWPEPGSRGVVENPARRRSTDG